MAKVLPDDIDFAAYMRMTDAQRKVQPAKLWVEEMTERLGTVDTSPQALLPWQKTHELFAIRPGEVTLWAGVNGHGKSLLTGQVVLSLMAQGERVCVASFEMKPFRTLERMCRQFSCQRPNGAWMTDQRVLAAFRDIYEQFGIFTDDRLWLYDQQGSVQRDVLMGMIRYCATELRIGHIVIDSLMKCIAGEDDYNAQKDFVDELCAVARDFGVHIHLVHHIKKLGSEADIPSKFDVKGSGSITDQVDNLMIVWRNKKKERDAQEGKSVTASDADAFLLCEKQRNGEWEGRIGLWFEPESQQYVANCGAPALDFATWPHRG